MRLGVETSGNQSCRKFSLSSFVFTHRPRHALFKLYVRNDERNSWPVGIISTAYIVSLIRSYVAEETGSTRASIAYWSNWTMLGQNESWRFRRSLRSSLSWSKGLVWRRRLLCCIRHLIARKLFIDYQSVHTSNSVALVQCVIIELWHSSRMDTVSLGWRNQKKWRKFRKVLRTRQNG